MIVIKTYLEYHLKLEILLNSDKDAEVSDTSKA
jgi:hypothetical protein